MGGGLDDLGKLVGSNRWLGLEENRPPRAHGKVEGRC